VSYYFNADFETCIIEKRPFNPKLAMNREFEYFIMLLESEPLFTTLDYSNDYIAYIRKHFNANAQYTKLSKDLIPWCADRDVSEEIVSKKTAALFNKEVLGRDDIQIVSKGCELKEGHLYKRFHGFSGMGHFMAPREANKISELLSGGEELIEEPLFERVYDFSTLIVEGKRIRYQNIVDKSFHYKGSIIRNFDLGEMLEEQYQREIDLIIDHYQKLGISEPFSIDSFIYKENKKLKLITLSEVNARKSMGYIAYKLSEKFPANMYALMLDRKEHSESAKVLKLNPSGKRFNTYFYLIADEKELSALGLRLL
tara:strand:+ start:59679 stop:60614 length:936 start_codon:yes stop_codon:yes gene_type:complete